MESELIVHKDPKSSISEMFRTLRTNLQFMNNKQKLKSVLLTSTLPQEGKSFVSANLAVAFAQMGKKVILVDADMRKGRQYTIFNLLPKPGLSNYLVDSNEEEIKIEDYIQKTEVDGLFAITAGSIPPNPSELLVSDAMIDLLEKLKEMCDILIIDGPPTQLVTDSLILTRMVDSTVIVTVSGVTKKSNLHKMIDSIQNVNGKIAGIVVNKIPISSQEYKKGYYYGQDKDR